MHEKNHDESRATFTRSAFDRRRAPSPKSPARVPRAFLDGLFQRRAQVSGTCQGDAESSDADRVPHAGGGGQRRGAGSGAPRWRAPRRSCGGRCSTHLLHMLHRCFTPPWPRSPALMRSRGTPARRHTACYTVRERRLCTARQHRWRETEENLMATLRGGNGLKGAGLLLLIAVVGGALLLVPAARRAPDPGPAVDVPAMSNVPPPGSLFIETQ